MGKLTVLPADQVVAADFKPIGSRSAIRPTGTGAVLLDRGGAVVGGIILTNVSGASGSELLVLDGTTLKREFEVTFDTMGSDVDFGQMVAAVTGGSDMNIDPETAVDQAAGVLRAGGWSPTDDAVHDIGSQMTVALTILEKGTVPYGDVDTDEEEEVEEMVSETDNGNEAELSAREVNDEDLG